MSRFVVVSQPSTYSSKEEAIRAAKVGAAGAPGESFYIAELQVEIRADLVMREHPIPTADDLTPIAPLIQPGHPDPNGNIWPAEALAALAKDMPSLYIFEDDVLFGAGGVSIPAELLLKQAAYSLRHRRDSAVVTAPSLHADDPLTAECEDPETSNIPF